MKHIHWWQWQDLNDGSCCQVYLLNSKTNLGSTAKENYSMISIVTFLSAKSTNLLEAEVKTRPEGRLCDQLSVIRISCDFSSYWVKVHLCFCLFFYITFGKIQFKRNSICHLQHFKLAISQAITLILIQALTRDLILTLTLAQNLALCIK